MIQVFLPHCDVFKMTNKKILTSFNSDSSELIIFFIIQKRVSFMIPFIALNKSLHKMQLVLNLFAKKILILEVYIFRPMTLPFTANCISFFSQI